MDINQSTEKLNDFLFFERNDLVEVTVPDGITSIGERTFSNCKNLRKITLPDSIISIGPSAFAGCENLEEIVLPKNIKKISYRTFADCKRLKKVVIPEGIEKLEWAIFSGCENLEEIVLPDSIKIIKQQLFLNCKKLKKVILPKELDYLSDECFKGCKQLNIKLSDKIKKIGNRTFENCFNLSNYPTEVISFGAECFKNCRSLKEVKLHDYVYKIPYGMFDGCVNLNKISYNGNNILLIGEKSFRNCKSITKIPEFITNYNERTFENCTGLEEITIKDHNIPFACFRGCSNIKKISNQEYIHKIGNFAFANCSNLEEIDLKSLKQTNIPAELFSNCKKLKKVNLHCGIYVIGSRAFYNCPNLVDINLPDTLKIIKKETFKFCNSIKKITIPANLKFFGDQAFSSMDNLEEIYVSQYNKNFITPDHKILLDIKGEKLVLYASGCKDKKYSLKDYNVEIGEAGNIIIRPITYIGAYAFSGNKFLEELTICSCTDSLEISAFKDCINLKKLNIEGISFFTSHGFNLLENGYSYTDITNKRTLFIPFETVEYKGEIYDITVNALQEFSNIMNITLPNFYTCSINSNAFTSCKKLKQVFIPKNVKTIKKDAFPSSTTLEFNNGLKINDLIELYQIKGYSQSKEVLDNISIHKDNDIPNDEKHVKVNPKRLNELITITEKYLYDYTLYKLNNETFYIEHDDKITTISKKYIDKICSYPEEIRNDPVLFLDFMNDLINNDLAIRPLFNGILMSKMNIHSRKLLVETLKSDDSFFLEVLNASEILNKKDGFTELLLEHFEYVISKINILKKYNIIDPILYHKLFMCCVSDEIFEELIKTNYDLFKQVIKDSEIVKLIDFSKDNLGSALSGSIFMYNNANLGENLLTYINLIKDKKSKDKFLMNPLFITNISPLCTKLIKNFDENMKRLLKASKILDGNIHEVMSQNYKDLLNLLGIVGALEDDQITRQKACTFITEKIFDEKLPNDEHNEFRIVGDDIHRIFNFGDIHIEYDEEFATFFFENYKELFNREKISSGFIERVYKNFKDISKTCTSNKGSQRKLKVTFDKCINYLLTSKFENVNEENMKLASLIGCWYDENKTWEKVLMIYNESLKAPRNIFTKFEIDENDNINYDNDPANDLREELNENFSFEWLPKQDYYNLILGKYCNCCAHIEGAGQGIMRASMILDNCQNLVIRDHNGIIIAKSTLYVNKEEGYAVFNNVESSLKRRTAEELKKIYNAFMRGINAFVKVYNENNSQLTINKVTIGTNRNTILDYLENKEHPVVDILKSLNYGEYSINGWSGYNGDWKKGQRLVLKK